MRCHSSLEEVGFQRSSAVTLASVWPGAEHICCGRWTHGLDRLLTEVGGWWDRSEAGWRGNRGVGGLDLTLEARAAWTSVPLSYPHQLTSPQIHTIVCAHRSTRTHTHTHTHTEREICCLQRFIIPNPDRIKEASPDIMSPVRAQGRSPDWYCLGDSGKSTLLVRHTHFFQSLSAFVCGGISMCVFVIISTFI